MAGDKQQVKQRQRQKWCWYHQRYEPVENFATNASKPDGLQSECRQAQAEKRGKIAKRVVGVGIGVAIAMGFHWLFSGILGMFGVVSGAMPWNWFSDASSPVEGNEIIGFTEPGPPPEPDIEEPISMNDQDSYRIPSGPSPIEPFIDDTFLEENIEPEPIEIADGGAPYDAENRVWG